MSTAPYIRPSRFRAQVLDRLAALFGRILVTRLSVRGRSSGEWRTVPVAVLDHGGQRYLIAPRGDTHWARNLRVAGTARLRHRGRTESVTATEVAVADRPPLIAAYRDRYGRFPTVVRTFEALPDPADHPTFRLASEGETPQDHTS